MLLIPKDSAVYRMYAWSIGLQEALAGEPLKVNYLLEGTNLCHLVRSIVVHIPLVLLLQIMFVTSPIVAFVWLPVHLLGIGGWVHMLEFVGSIVVVGGLTGLISYVRKKYSYNIADQQIPLPNSVFRVVKEWAKARKASICPMIEWRQP